MELNAGSLEQEMELINHCPHNCDFRHGFMKNCDCGCFKKGDRPFACDKERNRHFEGRLPKNKHKYMKFCESCLYHKTALFGMLGDHNKKFRHSVMCIPPNERENTQSDPYEKKQELLSAEDWGVLLIESVDSDGVVQVTDADPDVQYEHTTNCGCCLCSTGFHSHTLAVLHCR